MKRKTSAQAPTNSAQSRRPAARPAAASGRSRARPEVRATEVMVFAAVSAVEPTVTPGPGTVELQPVRIGYFKPEAGEVFVAGTFNDWNPRATPLKRDDLGDWAVVLQLPPGEYRYRLVVDGEWRDDPCAQQTARNPFGGFDAVVTV
jgi:1,4-alpha-glucan branching enzyme